MQKGILTFCLFFSTTLLAQVNPLVMNWGSRAEVQIWNTSDRNVTCSGSVNMYMQSGYLDSQFVSLFVFSDMSTSHSLYPRNFQDTISWVSHSIFCF